MFKNPKYIYGEDCLKIPANVHIGDYLLKTLWKNGDTMALINGVTNETLTHRQIAQTAMNVAVSLAHLGVRKGDMIAISSENRNEFWACVIGVLCSGAVVTTINTGYTKDELKHVLGISKPKFIICSPSSYKRQAKNFESAERVIVFGDERFPNTISYNDLTVPNNSLQPVKNNSLNANNNLKEQVNFEDFLSVEVERNDTAFVLYSSGTTGFPKGVMISHLNAVAACTPKDTPQPNTFLMITPWYHSIGLITNLRHFIAGSTVVYIPKFEVDLYLKTIEKYKIPVISVVPPVLVALSKAQTKYDLSSVVVVSSGAAPLHEETALDIKKIFPNVQFIVQGYGLTEATLMLTGNFFNAEKIGSVGSVVYNTVMKIVDPESGKTLDPHEIGEIRAKGISIMKGYVGLDRSLGFDEEGFLKTGDLGYFDEDNYLYIVGRLKELIKYKGYQVPPAEIESVLLKHEGINDAAVVGLPDVSAGELPLAFVVLQPGARLTEKEIQKYVAERLSNPKHLRGGVRFVSEIPKNPTGKILRRELKNLLNMKSKI